MINERHMKAIIFAAPSGSGKTTIVHHLLQNNSDLQFSISATTRDRRNDTEQYYFLTVEEFKKKIDNDEFVEWEEVYPNKFYGTLKTEIERIWALGKNVIFDVDVKGGISLKNFFKDDGLSVFVQVPNIETLRERLVARGSETVEMLKTRLDKAEYEMTFMDKFDARIYNADLDKSFSKAQWLYDLKAGEVTHLEKNIIYYKGNKYSLLVEKLKIGDLYYNSFTDRVETYLDVDYDVFDPNNMNCEKLNKI